MKAKQSKANDKGCTIPNKNKINEAKQGMYLGT